ncbi:MAG: hypothetical protein J6P72_11180 [Firmicutes bacterium]|nr:hypothetical protein [Bacillota bacterium]
MSNFPYEDIVDLPRPVSKKHKPMPMEKRAAQFLPFAAVTGYESAIEKAAQKKQAAVENEVELIVDPDIQELTGDLPV